MEKNKKKKYNFFQVLKCEDCGTVPKIPGPCEKCGKKIFVATYNPQEI